MEGTRDAFYGPETEWREYEFLGKPGDPQRRPPQFAPYHLRLDWLVWFLRSDSAPTSRRAPPADAWPISMKPGLCVLSTAFWWATSTCWS